MRKVLAAVVLLALAACGHARVSTAGGLAPCKATDILGPGQPVPASCRFHTLSGAVMTLGDLKGKPFLLNFWASWCPNCVEEMPALQQAHERLGDRVAIVGADLTGVDGETLTSAREFARKRGVTYVMIQDNGGLLFGHFSGATLPPTTIWVDARGIVRYRQFGQLDLASTLDLTRRYLGVG